jgi:AhpC/TSA family
VAKSVPPSAAGKKATGLMLEKHADHPVIDDVVAMIARAGGDDADTRLKALLENSSKRVKAAANLALARSLAEKVDDLADKPSEADKVVAEAEKHFTAAIEFYKDNADRKKEAETELNAMRNLRVGREAPDIKGPDLDGKEFKLSDYRGKVVLLDFWGNW